MAERVQEWNLLTSNVYWFANVIPNGHMRGLSAAWDLVRTNSDHMEVFLYTFGGMFEAQLVFLQQWIVGFCGLSGLDL